jgi:hypothetical protein
VEPEKLRSRQVAIDVALSEFFREASVLVGVFGPLDPILKGDRITAIGMVAVLGATVALFLVGLFFTIRSGGERWAAKLQFSLICSRWPLSLS